MPRRVVLLLLVSTITCLFSNEPLKTDFIIGVQDIEEYLPYSQIKDNDYIGFNRELLDMFAEYKGYNFTYEPRPIKRLLKEFTKGKYDFKYPDNPYWASDVKKDFNIIYSNPAVEFIDGVIVTESNKDLPLDRLQKLGMILGYTPVPYLNYISEEKVSVSTSYFLKNLLVLLEREQIDGIYINIDVAKCYTSSEQKFYFNTTLPYIKATRHLSTINYPKIIDEFNDFILEKQTEIKELKKLHKVEREVNRLIKN